MPGQADDDLEELRRARPAQEDPIARRLEAKVRAALVGAEVEPTRVDRFVVLDRLGAGGMGVVYAAHDPRLERKVALKLIHARGERARARVLDEARALARLSHPNVVAVYDASEVDGALYIAMELVAGTTARAWLAAARRPSAEIVAVFAQAGRGLAAAHTAGLCHGDVKPDNILVGDGAVKVADFGLARAEAGDDAAAIRGGTPAYMAPEQLAGGGADARADQFGFAVALYEALAGRRPYDGRSVDELAAAMRAGPPAPLTGVPARVAGAVARALAVDPAARWPSMTALLAALDPPPPSRAARVARYAVPAAIAGGAIAIVLARGGGAAPACPLGDERVAAVWTPAVRAQVPPRAAAVLDAYGRAWAEMAHQTCEATRRGTQSQAMLDLRMACLDRRLDELGALAGELAGASTPAELDAAIEAAYALSPLEPCADRERLAGVLPPPAKVAAAVAALRRRIDVVRLGQKTRRHPQVRTELAALVDEARALGYPPLVAEALLDRALLENHAGDTRAAEATLREAIEAAAAARDDETAARAWITRVFVAGAMEDRHAEAIAYAEAAEATLARTSRPAAGRGLMKIYVGQVERRRDRLPAARAALDEAVRLLEEAHGTSHPLVAEALDELGNVAQLQGDHAAARRAGERALAIFEAAYGPDHPDTTVALSNLANLVLREGDLDGAADRYREVVRRTVAHSGADHPNLAIGHHNLGDVLRRLGRDDEARLELEAARAIFARTIGLDNADAINTLAALAKLERDPAARRRALEDVLARRVRVLGEAHHTVADTVNDLGNLARDQGELDRALELYQRALRGYERALGADHPRVPVALSNLGETAIAGGRFADAVAACTRALAIDERALGPAHPDLAYDLTCLGEARLGEGAAAPAVALLERALALRPDGKADPGERARTQFALARALWAGGGDRTRARALARDAKAAMAADGAATAAQRTAVARWLQQRGG
ncbi:MAG TPA: serine/threonine-protein kinase [Kofleriaceae bacterium]|jgi:tetratricopeptide (TPR) repeat protein|nr:serine/threonine-protein kinase [Kofleriaceae bacterium]